MVIDSLHQLHQGNASIPLSTAMEQTMRGYIEYFATNLRMYYSANAPPGRRAITGTHTVWRVGYHGSPIVLAGLLPPLTLIVGLAATYTALGIRAGTAPIADFDPVDTLSLLIAGAAGGQAGTLALAGKAGPATSKIRVRYNATEQRLESISPALEVFASPETGAGRASHDVHDDTEDTYGEAGVPLVQIRAHLKTSTGSHEGDCAHNASDRAG